MTLCNCCKIIVKYCNIIFAITDKSGTNGILKNPICLSLCVCICLF